MENKAFWNKVFGFKVGDIIRPKFGKCFWEIYAIIENNGDNLLKVRRLRRTRHGFETLESVSTTFHDWEIVEVTKKEITGEFFSFDDYIRRRRK